MSQAPEFPDDFLWGTATSAYQIEGATEVEGRGPSIWDRFAATPGKIADGSDGRVACDHYHRFDEDVALMRDLGVDAYRFSVAWPRVIPDGRGPVNEAGLDFYERLVDRLLEAGIRPFLTLYHWDLSAPLQDSGGWPQRDVARAFVDYGRAVARRLGDRVKDWATHNEPWCIATLGYELGQHAPGLRQPAESLAARHHLLVSHGWTVDAIRHEVPDASVGIVLNLTPAYAASASEADRNAQRRFDAAFNRWFLDPLYGRGYPADGIEDRRRDGHLPQSGPLPFVQPGDLAAIATPTDYLGVNYYSRAVLRSTMIPEADNLPRTIREAPQSRRTDMGWEIYPAGLSDLLRRVHAEYRPPRIYITECGAAFATGPDPDGRVPDRARQAFLEAHFEAARQAIGEGVPLDGFFVWSLLDNFEWAEGYTKRFGLTWVDYETQARTLKDSALWFRDKVIRARTPPSR